MFWNLPQPFDSAQYQRDLSLALKRADQEHMREVGQRMAQNRIELGRAGQLYI